MPGIRVDYAVRETATNMKRNVFMLVQAIIVVSITLFLVGCVVLFSGSVRRAADLQTKKVEVAVFLAKDVTPAQRDAIQQDLLQMPEVARVIYESKQDAYENFKKLFQDSPDIVENVTADALPESFRVKLKDPSKFTVVKDRLTGVPGIERIRDEQRFVSRLLNFVAAVRVFGIGLVVVFAIAAGVLISSTIRMAIYARRKEIGIMRLVGATNWFIRVPFMLEGVAQGIIGSAIAVGLLVAAKPVLSGVLSQQLRNLGFRITYGDIVVYGIYLLVAGILVGAVGSMLGLRRFLDV